MKKIIILLFLFSLSTIRCSTKNETRQGGLPDEKVVVLTFDDAVKSHLTFVAPKLKELGFGATFFVGYEWMDDTVNFLSWKEIAEIHNMGFEIGNHAWNHISFAQPKSARALEGELGLVNWMLMRAGVPKPVSYAYNGNAFGPEAVKVLQKWDYKFARRGMQPEIPYGDLRPGPAYNPSVHHHLLIPTTRDGYPDMSLKDFVKAVKKADKNEIVVLQFHGIPDTAHPWVNTEPERFIQCMQYLKEHNYKVIAMKDLEKYLPEVPPDDPMSGYRYDLRGDDEVILPDEVISTQADLNYWLENMKSFHYSLEEMMEVSGLSISDLREKTAGIPEIPAVQTRDRIMILPYPGGRHPRIKFHEGMLSPMRGTKAGIFLPWDGDDYIVLDLPEAVISQYGLIFLGHKHIPTVYDYKKIDIKNSDWEILKDGGLKNKWRLPGNIVTGAEIYPDKNKVRMELWLTNQTKDTLLTGLQTQVCIMFMGAAKFDSLTNENKIFDPPLTAIRSDEGDHWIITAWDRCSHSWGNPDCPCMHADPKFPDCAPGETVKLSGEIWFYTGKDIKAIMKEAKNKYKSTPYSDPNI